MMPRQVRPNRWPRIPLSLLLLPGFLSAPLLGCGATGGEGGGEMEATPQQAEPLTLGPRDGFDLPPTDLERVAVGAMAPDFSLRTTAGETLTLSAFRGAKNVVLVFYRGHW
ncbi:MAG: redoxin domain-containing protein [Longimicrobiales bacterium]|nr:redoxin domain-containing protein [Longimicrobiales bacterium]